MDIQQIFKNNALWIEKQLEIDSRFFQQLSKGQQPSILYIGCSDSRVTAEDIMGLRPGEAFVHRNIANVVPNLDFSAKSVVNYAVNHLKVDHIIVCGHYGCGGVKAAMQSANLGRLNPWLREIRDVYRLHRAELDNIANIAARYRRFVELNVQEQCTNLLKTMDVQAAIRDRALTVHGWVFDMRSGQLIDLKIDIEALAESIRNIYQMSE